MAGAAFGRLATWIEGIFKSEKLDELPEIRGDGSAGTLLSWLLKPESLPMDVAKPGEGTSFLAWLLAAEKLPGDGQTAHSRTRTSFLKTLFSRERLLRDPTPDEAGGTRPPRRRPGL
jgi:hypothetical protein